MPDDENERRTGYGKPPKSGQFKPGQSGNPKGRPRKDKRAAHPRFGEGLVPIDQAILKVGDQLITMREGERAVEITQQEAVIRSMYARAIKGGPMAQRTLVEFSQQAQALEATHRRSIWESYKEYIAWWRDAEARAQAQGTGPPSALPHPDDIEFGNNLCVYVRGPSTQDELKAFQKCVDFRDLYLALHVYGCSVSASRRREKEQPNLYWWLYSFEFNRHLPQSLRLPQSEMDYRAERLTLLRNRDLEQHIAALGERAEWSLRNAIRLSKKPPTLTVETMGFKWVHGLLVRKHGWSLAKQIKECWANVSVDHLTTEKLDLVIALGIAGPAWWVARARASIAAREHAGAARQ